MHNMLAAIVAGTMLVSAGSADAQRRPANAGYEAQEDAIYNAVFRHLLPLSSRGAMPGTNGDFCVLPTVVGFVAPGPYLATLRQSTDERFTRGQRARYPFQVRYAALANRHLRNVGNLAEANRELDLARLAGGLSVERVPPSECDALNQYRLYRPIFFGATAFLAAERSGVCEGDTYRFALARRNGRWHVEGYRWGDTRENDMGGCNRTPRSQRGSHPSDFRLLRVKDFRGHVPFREKVRVPIP